MTLDLSQFSSQCTPVFRFKGTVSTENDLPKCSEVGDVIQIDQWRINKNETLFCVCVVWDGEQWIKLDPFVVE